MEARSWLGTPYHSGARVRGAGVDCAMFPLAVYSACGLIEAADVGHYPHDWHLHRDDERYLGWVERLGAREIDAPAPGDFALFRVGRAFAHGAIVIDWPLGIHAVLNEGVVLGDLTQSWLTGRPVRFFSVLH